MDTDHEVSRLRARLHWLEDRTIQLEERSACASSMNGGTLLMESTAGHGTTCTVRLPLEFVPSTATELSGYNVSGIWG